MGYRKAILELIEKIQDDNILKNIYKFILACYINEADG